MITLGHCIIATKVITQTVRDILEHETMSYFYRVTENNKKEIKILNEFNRKRYVRNDYRRSQPIR